MIRIKSDFISKICATYVILWTFIPPVQVGMIYRVLAIGAMIIWLLSTNFGLKNAGKDTTQFAVLALLTAVLLIVNRCFILSIESAITTTIQFIIMMSCGLISFYYFRNDKTFVKHLILIALLCICFFCVTTMIGLAANPYASRIANSEWLSERFQGNENVGLYGYVYMCVLICPMLFYKILMHIKTSKLFDWICLISFILILCMISMAGYMIAIFCTILSCGLIFVLYRNSWRRVLFFASFMILFLLFARPLISWIFDVLMDYQRENPVYYSKLSDFKAVLLEGNFMGETVFGRLKNYTSSWREIVSFPLVGANLFGTSLGGGHSFILDTLGKTGLLIAILNFTLVYWYPFRIYRTSNGKTILKVLTIPYLVFTLLDPMAQEMGIAMYLFLPFFIFLSDTDRSKTKYAEPQENTLLVREQNEFFSESLPDIVPDYCRTV